MEMLLCGSLPPELANFQKLWCGRLEYIVHATELCDPEIVHRCHAILRLHKPSVQS